MNRQIKLPLECVLCAIRKAAGWVWTPSDIIPKYTVLPSGTASDANRPTKPGSRWWNFIFCKGNQKIIIYKKRAENWIIDLRRWASLPATLH